MKHDTISRLTTAVAAVAPISGVSIGRWTDRSSWRVDFDPTATAEQIANASSVIASFDPLNPPLTESDYATAMQTHIDDIAKSRGYADGVALAGYSTSTIPAWAEEAAAFIAWRDAVWIYAYTQLAKVQGGQRAMPTLSDFVAELPAIKWP